LADFLVDENIRRFELLLKTSLDGPKRAMIEDLLAEERCKRVSGEDGGAGSVEEPPEH
jgi:hypothetical protein